MVSRMISIVCLISAQLLVAPAAFAAHLHYLSSDDYQSIRATVAPVPANGSAAEQADIDELFTLQKNRTAADCARANASVGISLRSFFGAPYGPLTPQQLKTLNEIFETVRSDTGFFVSHLKEDFHRQRPYNYIAGLQPCVPRDSSLAYPSGHATTAMIEALVMSEILPSLKTELVARAYEIANDRVLGGVHHPSDVVAGEKLAEQLFELLKRSPAFRHDVQVINSI